MAMKTQQSEGALLNEKPLQAALAVGKDGPNRSSEVNGHTSPRLAQHKHESDSTANGGTVPVGVDLAKNKGAFSANQALPEEIVNDGDSAGPKGVSEDDAASGGAKEEVQAAASLADAEMPNASAEDTNRRPKELEGKASEGIPTKSQSGQPLADLPDDSIQSREEPTPEGKDGQTGAHLLNDEDMAMTSTEARTKSSAPNGPSESTQPTAPSDAAPCNPNGDADILQPDSQMADADDSSCLPAAADTSLYETVQPTAKVSRERDADPEDEPVAKRTKMEHAGAEVQVKSGNGEDRMEFDQQTGVPKASVSGARDEPKNLSDNSLNDSPISDWQNKQIRQVLAGVKKTKVGSMFRLPVQQLWPQLWADYSAKVSSPTDISSLEKRLRGDGPVYATMGEFKQDLELLVQNSVAFNGELHDVTSQAKACRDAILSRMAGFPAVEPPRPERKEPTKTHTHRHVEPRAVAVPPISTAGPGRPSKGGAASPPQKSAVPESPAFALPPGSNGMPLIRRDSTKPDSRAKRPVKPAHPKDLVYDTKRKKKLPMELRFCDEVLTELRKTKHYEINTAFMQPVDPVALNIPTYHKVIKKPMDLQTMMEKLSAGEYATAKEFEKDFDLIIKNCKTFNGEDHVIYAQALKLQDLYRAEMSRKDEWMAKHAPVSAAAASHAAASSHLRDDSDSEEADSEADPEQDDERKQIQHRLATIQKRLDQEQSKINEMVNSGTAEIADVEIAQSVVAMLQKQLMQERAKLASLPPKKLGKPSKPKSKKAGGTAGVTGKKAAVVGAGGGGGGAKKSGSKKAGPKRKIGQIEKEIIIDSLGNLDGQYLERAIDLIKKDTGQGENDAGELELDIDMVSEEALIKLYDNAIKAFPHARAEKERRYGYAQPSSDQPAAKSKTTKSKKNKPMSKTEQERRIQQLNELRAQAGGQASGSQEPMDLIEGNGLVTQPDHESEDEVDSEED